MTNPTSLKQVVSVVALCAFVLLMGTPIRAGETAVVGKWLVEDKTGVIQIYKCGAKYCGKTVWIKPSAEHPDPSALTDTKNPDPKKRNDKLLGKTTLWGLSYNADKQQWEDGSIYDSRSGKVYSCQVTMEGPAKLLLRGFLGISLIGQTTVWTKKAP